MIYDISPDNGSARILSQATIGQPRKAIRMAFCWRAHSALILCDSVFTKKWISSFKIISILIILINNDIKCIFDHLSDFLQITTQSLRFSALDRLSFFCIFNQIYQSMF